MSMLLSPQTIASRLATYGITGAALFDGSSGYLVQTPGLGNRRTWTISCWCQLGDGVIDGGNHTIFNAGESTNPFTNGLQVSTTTVRSYNWNGTSYDYDIKALGEQRDPTAWYHVVVAVDTTQATATDRVKIYINGIDQTDTTGTYPALNFETNVNFTTPHNIGRAGALEYWDGYVGEMHFVDGEALVPSSFGVSDAKTGNWIAKKYTGTYGSNGFYLDFSGGKTTTANTYSGNLGVGSDWTLDAIRVKVAAAALTTSGRFVRVQFKSDGIVGWNITNAFIGKAATGGNDWDFDGNQIRLMFSGSNSATVAVSSTLYSDWTFLQLDAESDYIISMDCGSAAGLAGKTPGIGESCWYKENGAPEAVQTAPASYTQVNSTFLGVNSIDVIEADYIGLDRSANGNLWLANGTITQVTGTPTNTAATWNALTKTASVVLSDGNRKAAHTNNTVVGQLIGTLGSDKGKYYFEYEVTTGGTYPTIGVCDVSQNSGVVEGLGATNVYGSSTFFGYRPAGEKWTNGGATAYGNSWTTGDTVQVALDLDNGAVWFGKNNTWQGGASLAEIEAGTTTNAAYTGLSGRYGAAVFFGNNSEDVTLVSAANDWTYSAPTGFVSLSTDNLPKVSDSIDNHFKTVLYTGNGATNVVTGVGFQPGFVWYKDRTSPNQHGLSDAVRDVPGYLVTNGTDVEVRTSGIGIDSFDSDGFTLGSNSTYNGSGNSYVAWCANLSLSKTAGWAGSPTITPTKEIYNPSAMFKMAILSYTGNGTAGATLPHSLGVKPGMIIVKRTDALQEWPVYHASLGATKNYELDSSSGAFTYTNRWNDTEPTSTLITLGDGANVNASGASYVAYIFAPCDGIKIGSYTNNNSVDGPYINEGFNPEWSLIKTDSSSSWYIHDAARPGHNPRYYLQADTAQQEIADTRVDLTANGLKLRAANDPNYFSYTSYYILIGQPQSPSENPAR